MPVHYTYHNLRRHSGLVELSGVGDRCDRGEARRETQTAGNGLGQGISVRFVVNMGLLYIRWVKDGLMADAGLSVGGREIYVCVYGEDSVFGDSSLGEGVHNRTPLLGKRVHTLSWRWRCQFGLRSG